MFFLTGEDVTVNVPGGFENGFSFFYTSALPVSVDVYSEVDSQGTLLGTLNLNAQFTDNCQGDPNGAFCNFSPVGVTFSGVAKSIDFRGAINQVCRLL